MKALIVYDSHGGYTEAIARAIGNVLPTSFEVDVIRAGDPGSHLLSGVGLLLVGGPTEGHGPTAAIRQWLGRLGQDTIPGVPAAAFDTRLGWPKFLSGSAATFIAGHLRGVGAHVLVDPESFIVHGKENPAPDEAALEHVREWTGRVLAALQVPAG